MKMVKNHYTFDDLIESGERGLFGDGNAKLPLPPMLMLDRITSISTEGGAYNKGTIYAELDIKPSLWFFDCHFKDDPVMPGCLALDGMWQLIGFFLSWSGSEGKGRALGVKDIKFTGQVTQDVKKVTYKINIKRIIRKKVALCLADGILEADGKPIYHMKDLKVGLFRDI